MLGIAVEYQVYAQAWLRFLASDLASFSAGLSTLFEFSHNDASLYHRVPRI